MPYYRCGSCELTVYSGAGHSTARVCPNCGADLGGAPRRMLPAEPRRREVRRHLVREPQAGGAARRELEALGGDLDADQLNTAALLMTELVANSVQHAGVIAGGLFELHIALAEDRVRISVTDGGLGFTPAGLDADDPTSGHWGLQIVGQLADRWGVETDPRTVAWFELDRHAEGGDLAPIAAAASGQ
jgi:anti-sigma regulatory factor (Ser/Thr protein kinase)